jgi:nucleotide-binding universal stress UspA family protein
MCSPICLLVRPSPISSKDLALLSGQACQRVRPARLSAHSRHHLARGFRIQLWHHVAPFSQAAGHDRGDGAFLEDVVAAGGPAEARNHVGGQGGILAWVLLHAATGADLLVVGSRGHGTFTSALVGSVSQHLAGLPRDFDVLPGCDDQCSHPRGRGTDVGVGGGAVAF